MSTQTATGPITRPDLTDRPFGHTVQRDMAASPHAIYKAWTEDIDRWFAAPGTVLMRAEVDAPYFFETHFEGGRHPHYGRFLALDEDRRIEMTWVTGRGGTEGAETVLTVELEPARTGTHLRLTHAGFLDEAARAANNEAWPKVLEHLDETLTASQSARRRR
jgi:uncharacterized protein YndB with AHSA1/START domain